MIIYPATIAAQLRTALHNGDTSVLAALFHPNVRFQSFDTGAPTTCGCAQVLEWYQHRRDRGFRAHVEELFTYPASIVLGLSITRRDTGDAGQPELLYRLFRLKDDQVVHIRDFTDRTHALAAAYAPTPAAP